MKNFILKLHVIVGALALLTLSAPVFAGSSTEEASTAATHAGYAAKAKDIKMAHMHLHHAVNCLVGPGGPGFDANEANPCAAMGSGAIPDAADVNMRSKLSHALKTAEMGLASDDLTQATKKAAELQMELDASAM